MNRWAVGAALAIGGVGTGLALAFRPEAPAKAPAPEVPVAAPAPAPFRLGINEAVAVPMTIRDRGRIPPEQLAGMLAEDARLAREVGATLVRGHTGNFPRLSMSSLQSHPEWLESEGDAWVRAVQAEGLEAVAMVSPWPGNQTRNHTEQYLPPDLEAYAAYVRRVVERYDGDGVDDMPGLRAPVRYWEVDNEPDLKFSTVPRDPVRPMEPETFCYPKEYAQVLVVSARAIREAYPEAKVLNGGPYRPHAPSSQAWLRELFAQPGVAEAIDILSVHTYHDDPSGQRLHDGVRFMRSLAPGKPAWVTETSVSTRDGLTPEDQGRAVVGLAAMSAVAGAEALFWHTLADPPAPRGAGGRPRQPGAFSTNSLFQTLEGNQRVDKPAAAVFRALSRVLATDTLVGATADGPGAVRLRSGATLLWDGARPAPRGGVDLRTGTEIPPGSTARSPAYVR